MSEYSFPKGKIEGKIIAFLDEMKINQVFPSEINVFKTLKKVSEVLKASFEAN